MRAENRVEKLDEEGYRSLGKMLLGLVLETVCFQILSDNETLDGFVILGSLAGIRK